MNLKKATRAELLIELVSVENVLLSAARGTARGAAAANRRREIFIYLRRWDEDIYKRRFRSLCQNVPSLSSR